MKKLAGLICFTATVFTPFSAYAAADRGTLNKRLQSAQAVLTEIQSSPDKGIPQSILSNASCVVVVPGFKKAAFAVGAQYGQGVATCRNAKHWSAPVFVALSGGSFGFQIGAQSTDLIMIAMNNQGLQDMLKAKVKLGADAAASAGPVGRNAQAGTDWKLNAEFLTYSRSRGLFAGIDLDGTVLAQNDQDTKVMYGSDVPFERVLKGEQAITTDARPFVHTVAEHCKR